MNSVRDNDRITEYDDLESRIFSYCGKAGMPSPTGQPSSTRYFDGFDDKD